MNCRSKTLQVTWVLFCHLHAICWSSVVRVKALGTFSNIQAYWGCCVPKWPLWIQWQWPDTKTWGSRWSLQHVVTVFARHALFHFIISRPCEIVGERAASFRSSFYLKRLGLNPSLLLTRCWLGSRKLSTCSKIQRPLVGRCWSFRSIFGNKMETTISKWQLPFWAQGK